MSWETWCFACNVTMPNLLILLIGMGLRRLGPLDDAFCDSAMKLVFNLALPFLLFSAWRPANSPSPRISR